METHKNVPQFDSIQELADFWDHHDLTDFEAELEEVTPPIFERESELRIYLPPEDAAAVEAIAESQGLDSAVLVRQWVLDRVKASV